MPARSVRIFPLPILLHRCIVSVSGFICHCGRATLDVKTCTHIYLSMNLKLRWSMAVIRFALPTMQLMCMLNVNLLSTTTPRYFSITVSSSCTGVPSSSSVIVQLCFGYLATILVVLHFFEWNSSCHSPAHVFIPCYQYPVAQINSPQQTSRLCIV